MTEDRGWLRRAGRGRGADGWSVIWSVAEGRRGRRWREVRYRDVHVGSSLLLETGPDGRFAHLELSTASGLLTLHPEDDGATLHGNTIETDGIDHVRGLPWIPDGLVLLEGSTICKAAAANLLRPALPGPSTADWPAMVILPTLSVEVGPIHVERMENEVWRVHAGEPLELDEAGLPVLEDGLTWPLED